MYIYNYVFTVSFPLFLIIIISIVIPPLHVLLLLPVGDPFLLEIVDPTGDAVFVELFQLTRTVLLDLGLVRILQRIHHVDRVQAPEKLVSGLPALRPLASCIGHVATLFLV